MKKLWAFILITPLVCIAQTKSGTPKEEMTQEEKEKEVIDYSNIKKVLMHDGLSGERAKKDRMIKQIKKERASLKKQRSVYPTADDYWSTVSELWLVKNAQVLRWDFPKPEYGIAGAFKGLLEKFGYYNIEFKILIMNTPTVTHFGLPAGEKRFIFILSLPFIRSLDLTKVDISLILLEDFLRLRQGLFLKNLALDTGFLNDVIKDERVNKKQLNLALKRYSKVILETGFDFQQQFAVAKEIDQLLKSSPPLWAAYFKLYKKLDRFIKNDLLYKNFLKIYPSPELQLQWLSPKKKII